MTWRKAEARPARDRRVTPALSPSPQQPPALPASKRWEREQIQRARKTPLAPLLRRRGYPLRARPGENFLVEDHQDLVVKDSYWVWPSRQMKGNAIDFLMLIECRSFNEAMDILVAEQPQTIA
jgi:hypothetical protein